MFMLFSGSGITPTMRANALPLTLAFVLFASAGLRGAVLIDQSPLGTGGTITPEDVGWVWQNMNTMQNFGERVVFDCDVRITGMDIYSFSYWAPLGRDVLVKTWGEKEAAPDVTTLSSFATILSEVDTDGISYYPIGYEYFGVRAHADFGSDSFVLGANTPLWIGMTGIENAIAPIDLGLLGLKGLAPPADGMMWQFSGDVSVGSTDGAGDMAMRIYGERLDSPTVPDGGATLALLGLGLAGLAALRRRSRA